MQGQMDDIRMMEDFFGGVEPREDAALTYTEEPDLLDEFDEEPATYLPEVTARRPNQWDPKLIIDLALELDTTDDILLRYNLTEGMLNKLMDSRAFRRELATTMRDLRNEGLPFTKKSAIQAEAYLNTLDEMVHDRGTPPSVRLECIKSVVRWGKLEPKDEKDLGNNGNVVNVQINF